MKRYNFMNPKTMYDMPKAKEYLRTTYGIEATLSFDDYDSEMPRYIQQFIEESGYKEKINFSALEMNVVGSEKQSRWKNIIDEVCKIIANPQSYYYDILCAIYMGWIYSIEDYNLFKITIDESRKRGESKEECKKRVRSEKLDLEKMKNNMQIAWKRSDRHVNKENVRKLYPVPVLQRCDTDMFKSNKYGDDEKVDKNEIISIPGGCYDYHKTMISQAHINIFDVRTEIKDYTRYSFKNTYDIYDSLKESRVENLLLMEYSLGIGYINQMYSYIRKLDTINKVEDVLTVINAGTSITPFVIRTKIMNLIFSSRIEMANECEVDNATEFVDTIADIVSTVFERVLEIEWYKYCYFLSNKEKRFYDLCLQVKGIWEEYYSGDKVYIDWISECNINDWRNIKDVHDCFWDGMPEEKLIEMAKHFGVSKYPFDYWDKVIPMQIQNVFGEKVIIYIGAPRNGIGESIKCQVREKMEEMPLPETMEDIYESYFNLREEVYKEIKEKEKTIFKKMEIKIRKNNKTKEQRLDKQHVYALLSYEVIRSLYIYNKSRVSEISATLENSPIM